MYMCVCVCTRVFYCKSYYFCYYYNERGIFTPIDETRTNSIEKPACAHTVIPATNSINARGERLTIGAEQCARRALYVNIIIIMRKKIIPST